MRIKFILVITFIFLVCGCGSSKSSIEGNYYSEDSHDMYLKLYKNGSCDFVWGTGVGEKAKVNTCIYDTNDEEIKISFTMNLPQVLGSDEKSINCQHDNYTIDCGYYGTYSK